MPGSCRCRRAYWRRDHGEVSASYPARSAGCRRGLPVGPRTRGRRLMAQQKSEDRVVPDGGVMPAQPAGSSPGGQGKAVPVEEAASQLRLPIATAEVPRGARGADPGPVRGGTADARVPKAIVNARTRAPAMMEEVVERLDSALLKVVSNKGAAGPDGITVRRCASSGRSSSPGLRRDLLEGRWRPGEIRRALIPKAGGGQRGLGIPNVVDRVVMEAVRQVLEPLFEPTFHPSSHGFRPGRSCHTAVAEAGQHLRDGHEWVVDVDLEKFFDRVNHQRLMARLAQRVEDRRLLVLIGRLLRAQVVLPDGVVIARRRRPAGLAAVAAAVNIVLDELDWELARRGHRFVRYADDGNVYVRSERAGQRVMASLCAVHRTALAPEDQPRQVGRRPPRGSALPRLLPAARSAVGAVVVLLSQRTKRIAMARIRELTPRKWGGTLESCIHRVNVWLRGWHQFFGIAAASEEFMLRALDAHIRRRLRAIMLKHWRRRPTIARNLVALGVRRQSAWRRSMRDASPRGRSATARRSTRPCPRVLHRARPDPPGRSAPPPPQDVIAPTQPNWRWNGDRSRSRTGRRRGSQPAAPRSRVRTAQARFCGSRGGQPPRLGLTAGGGGGYSDQLRSSSTSRAELSSSWSRSWCWPASTASEASRAQPAAAEGRLDVVEKILTPLNERCIMSCPGRCLTSVPRLMLYSGRDGWSCCVVRSGEAGIGTGGVVGHRAAVQSGDGGVGRRERERGRRRGRGVAPVGARVGAALSGGGAGRVWRIGRIGRCRVRIARTRSSRRWSASCAARTRSGVRCGSCTS